MTLHAASASRMRAADLGTGCEAGVTSITVLAHEGFVRNRWRGFAVESRAMRAARFEAFEVVRDERGVRLREDMTLTTTRLVAHARRLRMRVRRSDPQRRTLASIRCMASRAFAGLRRMSNDRRCSVVKPTGGARLP